MLNSRRCMGLVFVDDKGRDYFKEEAQSLKETEERIAKNARQARLFPPPEAQNETSDAGVSRNHMDRTPFGYSLLYDCINGYPVTHHNMPRGHIPPHDIPRGKVTPPVATSTIRSSSGKQLTAPALGHPTPGSDDYGGVRHPSNQGYTKRPPAISQANTTTIQSSGRPPLPDLLPVSVDSLQPPGDHFQFVHGSGTTDFKAASIDSYFIDSPYRQSSETAVANNATGKADDAANITQTPVVVGKKEKSNFDLLFNIVLFILCCPCMAVYVLIWYVSRPKGERFKFQEPEEEINRSNLGISSYEGCGEEDCHEYDLQVMKKPVVPSVSSRIPIYQGPSHAFGKTNERPENNYVQLPEIIFNGQNCARMPFQHSSMNGRVTAAALSPHSSDRSGLSSAPSTTRDESKCKHQRVQSPNLSSVFPGLNDFPSTVVQSGQSVQNLTSAFVQRYFLVINFPSGRDDYAQRIREFIFKIFMLKHSGYTENSEQNKCETVKADTWKELDDHVKGFLKQNGKTAGEVTIFINGLYNMNEIKLASEPVPYDLDILISRVRVNMILTNNALGLPTPLRVRMVFICTEELPKVLVRVLSRNGRQEMLFNLCLNKVILK